MGTADGKKDPWFAFYPADFFCDHHVVGMSWAQKGFYVYLLGVCWRDGSIPDSKAFFANASHWDGDELEEAWAVIRPCFDRHKGALVSPRLEHERAERLRKSGEARRRGRTGGLRTQAKRKQEGKQDG